MADSQRRITDAYTTARRAGLRVMAAESGIADAVNEAHRALVEADAAAKNAADARRAAREALVIIAATLNILDTDEGGRRDDTR